MTVSTRVYDIILGFHRTEKAASCLEHNQFVIRVLKTSTKPEIKKAVESLLGVKVAAVNTVNVPGKVKRFGQRIGKRSDWKKAYVTLVAGQKLESLGLESIG